MISVPSFVWPFAVPVRVGKQSSTLRGRCQLDPNLSTAVQVQPDNSLDIRHIQIKFGRLLLASIGYQTSFLDKESEKDQ